MKIFEIIDINIVLQIVIFVAIFLFIKFGKGKINKDVYEDVKTALQISGMLFRQDKVKQIADIALTVVQNTEKLEMTNEEKYNEAVADIASELFEKFDIKADEKTLKLLTNTAVAHLPKTHK